MNTSPMGQCFMNVQKSKRSYNPSAEIAERTSLATHLTLEVVYEVTTHILLSEKIQSTLEVSVFIYKYTLKHDKHTQKRASQKMLFFDIEYICFSQTAAAVTRHDGYQQKFTQLLETATMFSCAGSHFS